MPCRTHCKDFGKLFDFGRKQIGDMFTSPDVPVQPKASKPRQGRWATRRTSLAATVQSLLIKYREAFIERQYHHERISDAACEIYASSCVLSRLDHLLAHGNHNPAEVQRDVLARALLHEAGQPPHQAKPGGAWDNDDAAISEAAKAVLQHRD